jgi:multidrug efflux pump subunit AcrA (membrane-fusion protein)
VRITSPALPDQAISATISRISPFLEATSFSTLGEIDLENSDDRLRPGMFVDTEILYSSGVESTLMPASALWTDPRTGLRGAFVVVWSPPAGESATDSALSTTVHDASFRPLEAIAEGDGTVGVRGIDPGEWVVIVGQHLLSTAGTPVRVRATSWERVLDLQSRQREDLLRAFLDKQQRTARTQGAEPPSSAVYFVDPGRSRGQPSTTPH